MTGEETSATEDTIDYIEKTVDELKDGVLELKMTASEIAGDYSSLDEYTRELAQVLDKHHDILLKHKKILDPPNRLEEFFEVSDVFLQFLEERKFPKALQETRKLIKKIPENPYVWIFNALLLVQKGDSDGARASIGKAKEFKDKYGFAYLHAAHIQFSAGNINEARENLRLLVQEGPLLIPCSFIPTAGIIYRNVTDLKELNFFLDEVACEIQPSCDSCVKASIFYFQARYSEAYKLSKTMSDSSCKYTLLLKGVIELKEKGERHSLERFIRSSLKTIDANPVSYSLLLDSFDYFNKKRQCSTLLRYLKRILSSFEWGSPSLKIRGQLVSSASAKAANLQCNNLSLFLNIVDQEMQNNKDASLYLTDFMLKLVIGNISGAEKSALASMKKYPSNNAIVVYSCNVFAASNNEKRLFDAVNKALDFDSVTQNETPLLILLDSISSIEVERKELQKKYLDIVERILIQLEKIMTESKSPKLEHIKDLQDRIKETKKKADITS